MDTFFCRQTKMPVFLYSYLGLWSLSILSLYFFIIAKYAINDDNDDCDNDNDDDVDGGDNDDNGDVLLI